MSPKLPAISDYLPWLDTTLDRMLYKFAVKLNPNPRRYATRPGGAPIPDSRWYPSELQGEGVRDWNPRGAR